MRCQGGYRWHREKSKRDQMKNAKQHSFKSRGHQALGMWFFCVCARTCTCEELLYDVRRCKKCGLHSVRFL